MCTKNIILAIPYEPGTFFDLIFEEFPGVNAEMFTGKIIFDK